MGDLRGTFIHETAGHSLGLLGDEYDLFTGRPEDEPYLGSISASDSKSLKKEQTKGRCLNVSLSNDPKQVPWSHLIGHVRFPYVDLHEGGYFYQKGVWRSENQSVMRDSRSVRYFNAISREMIVKRIMELSGEAYTFEKFLAKDRDAGRPGKDASDLPLGGYPVDYRHRPPLMGD